MPAALFIATSFPVDAMPSIIKSLMYVAPLNHTDLVIWKTTLFSDGIVSLCIFIAYSEAFFLRGFRLIQAYSE